MKIFVLGGAGGMGAFAVRTLAEEADVDEIVVGDIRLEVAERLASRVEKVRAVGADASDQSALAELLRGVDVVINTVGPFDHFGTVPLRAAIQAGVNYCDINDDWRPTLDCLDLDEDAKRAKITALIGIGASPGISNLLARHAADQLDEVEEIQTCWVSGGGGGDGGDAAEGDDSDAALEHMLLSAAGDVPTFRDGRLVNVPSFVSGEVVDFPGSGPYEVLHIGHPEPVTLSRFIPGVRVVSNLGALYPPPLNELVRQQADRIARGEVDGKEAAKAFMQAIYADPGRWLSVPPREDGGPRGAGGLCARAVGRKGDRRVRYTCSSGGFPGAGMAGVTGVPLAIGALMVGRGQISARGVLAPEACIDPVPFFQAFSRHWKLRFVPEGSDQLFIEVVEDLGPVATVVPQ